MFHIKIKNLSLLALFLLMFSCLPFFKTALPESSQDDYQKEEQTAIAQRDEEAWVIDDAREILMLIDTLVTYGEKYAFEEEFDGAIVNINLAIDLMLESPAPEEFEYLLEKEQMLYERIAKFYVALVPNNYLDSVPAEVSSYVTKIQFEEIMFNIEAEDGELPFSLTEFLECSNTAHYNVPLATNERVQTALVATLQARRKNYIQILLNRGIKYRPFMNEMFEAAGLPTDLTYLPMLESAFNMKAYSKAHASGVWQFIESTGKIFNMRNDYWLDERRDPIKATLGAIAYLTKLNNEFQDWHLSLAAYNCGEGRVRRNLRNSESKSYWDLELPKETMNYVPFYMVYQIIAKNPHCFGYTVDSTITPFEFDTVHVSDCIDMRKIANGISIEYELLAELNPHIKQWCTPPNTKNVTLFLPKGKTEEYKAFYAKLTPADKVNWYRYRIERGDNLGSIAKKFNTNVSIIQSINQMKGTTIVVGRYIFVPLSAEDGAAIINSTTITPPPTNKVSSGSSSNQQIVTTTETIKYKVKSGDTFYSIAKQFDVGINDIKTWNPDKNPSKLQTNDILTLKVQKKTVVQSAATTKTAIEPSKHIINSGDFLTYTVKSGDNLYQIAINLGVSLYQLIEWNDKDDKNPRIFPGEKLRYIPSGSNSTTNSSNNQKSTAQNITTVTKITQVLEYKVKSGDSFYSIARAHNTTVDELYNANSMNAKTVLQVGQTLIIPAKGAVKQEAPKASSKPTTNVTTKTQVLEYKVKSGDTFFSIARAHSTTVDELYKANSMNAKTILQVGQTLLIPSANAPKVAEQKPVSQTTTKASTTTSSGNAQYKVKSGDTFFSIARAYSTTVNELFRLNNMDEKTVLKVGQTLVVPNTTTVKPAETKAETKKATTSSNVITYRIKSGDTLYSLSRLFNVTVDEICKLNNITTSTPLSIGNTLKIPQRD